MPESSASPVPGGSSSHKSGEELPWGWITCGGILAGLLLFAGAVLVRRQAMLRLRAHRLTHSSPNQRALLLYKELLELYRAAETLLPTWDEPLPSQLEELALKARFSQHTLTDQELEVFQQELDRMTALLQRELPLPQKLWLAYGPVLF